MVRLRSACLTRNAGVVLNFAIVQDWRSTKCRRFLIPEAMRQRSERTGCATLNHPAPITGEIPPGLPGGRSRAEQLPSDPRVSGRISSL